MSEPNLTIVSAPTDALAVVNKAFRVCYRSEGKEKPNTREEFIKGFLRIQHESPVEHVSITFELSNISRACATQILRHRVGSYNQESLRYVDVSNYEYITPDAIAYNKEANKLFLQVVNKAKNTYKKLLELGIKKEDARACLPIATATRLIFTYNFRQIRHFLRERLSPRAQREIRLVACKMYLYMSEKYPWAVEDLAPLYEEAINKNVAEIKEATGGQK